ncbi:MAG: tRNA (adenosine(37)-N6)-threonylcarbamoyltransferase complex ATPase subunit type 1 TsaE [Ruminococcaceae bacterium]|nr:tRNA (adenosine(37)-N6)-threonylcarbamoyltransferase complex ATPase subunit type 1 TsaE [Oscillospiraceae bacterium]
MKVVSESVKQTENLGKRIASVLKGDEVIAMFGDLGAGKTAFTRGVASGLGFENGVSSPTFAIVNEYNAKFNIYHFDMYRITSEDDLYSVGFYDYLGNGVLIIEWSENIEYALEDNIIRIFIKKSDVEEQRIFTIEGLDEYENIIA